ncbi:lysozyme [Brevundimonas sp.]|uniref:lysozyme n=1 Tax=Brevundimonas sp. TaxID=1871086 RepID=UPI002FC74B22
MSDATTPRLKVSREGVVLIKSFEGFRPHAVRDEDGRWVIGYGHTASAREGLSVGEQDAELLLQYDLLPVVKALNERAPAGLNQHQFDALASFAISVGVERFLASDVLQRLNEGQAGQAADALIGWPESPSPDARLRRRAAERALFIADPGVAVTLADLLAAPLPPPPVEPTEPEAEAAGAPDARAAAVAALLGEAIEPETAGAAPVDAVEPQHDQQAEADPAPAAPAAVFSPGPNRYSPYAATIVGPLPGFEPAAPAPAAAAEAVQPEAPAAGTEAASPIPPAPESFDPTPVIPLVSPAPAVSPFPPMDQPLVLTPLTEADLVTAERPVWPEEARAAPLAADETVLFEDEPTSSVLRHEVEPEQPRRFDWADTGAFLIMGGVGLAACGASAAAFRLAVEQPSPMGETSVIAWALALIGVICVGVSSWNLYVRWGRPD